MDRSLAFTVLLDGDRLARRLHHGAEGSNLCRGVCMYMNIYIASLTNPPIPSSPCNHMGNLKKMFLLHRERGHPKVPPCNHFKNLFFFIFPPYMGNIFLVFFPCDYIEKWSRTDLRPPQMADPLKRLDIYILMYIIYININITNHLCYL